ncbi:hypothetical protein Scep_017383 [Stephania cephalantha]|uniref:Phosphofructokinase domain-containing protein n=1 Tax=Stephania cephalantha TaxID=152367 RepID=A0AAP0NVM1_9MAGN
MAFASLPNGVGLINLGQSHLHKELNECFNVKCLRFGTSKKRLTRDRPSSSIVVRAVAPNSDIDFSDPDWKQRYQEEFEKRFSLPHLRDVFDLTPIPTTFFLKNRGSQVVEDASSTEEKKYGYVNDDDRALLRKELLSVNPDQITELYGLNEGNSCLVQSFGYFMSCIFSKERNVIKFSSPTSAGAECIDPNCSWVEQWVHRAGPRQQIYFEPGKVKAGILTCGGLCPGLNDVIRQLHTRSKKSINFAEVPAKFVDFEIVLTLEIYGVKNIVGIPYGYRGFFDKGLHEVPLSRQVVQNINLSGGSLLGVSRGNGEVSDIVDSIQARRIDMLFILGGNGTHAGANAIHEECRKRKLKICVVGVPKTIDNDILLMDKTFGFDTAVEEAQRAINSAYIEAHSAYHGIGLVKLMGRNSGFIAMHATLSSGQIDVCLIPEVPFKLDGPYGLLKHLEHLIENKGSAVVCVAEGAGQDLLEKSNARDLSGNVVFGDIGVHIQQKIKKHFKEINVHADVKYIDPTYMIRAVRANASDAILCTVLGQNAVHGAFAGFSGITVGICNTHYVYLPIPEVISSARSVDPNSRMWHRCMTSTGQPDFL